MITINVGYIDNYIKVIKIKGHANSNEYGKDLVCAGVSTVVTGGLNALAMNYLNHIKYELNEGYALIEILENNDEIQIILNTILIQLQTVEESNKKYIKIKQTHGGV